MRLTTIKVGEDIVRTKKEKLNFLLNNKVLRKTWLEDFIDEDTGQVVTIKRVLQPTWLSHKELNKTIFKFFRNAEKV